MSIGVRVVRGPDWKWGDQDGGKGCVGTVVPAESSQSAKGVWVRWDSGRKANYRAGGEKGTYDLRIYDNAQLGVKHPHINCDCCPEEGIVGIRWKCLECHDFDLCHSCYNKGKHGLDHRFKRIETNSVPGVEVPCRLSVTKCRSLGIFPGARVVRGPDWEWGDQDGGEGKIGTVKEVIGAQGTHRSWVKVQWPNRSTNQYRRGHGGKLDVQYTQEDTAGEFYIEHLPRLVRPDFNSGDKVRLLDMDPVVLKELQKVRCGWNEQIEEYRGKVGEVIVVDKDGDVKVNFGGASFFINPLCLAMEKKKGAEDTKAGAGEPNAVESLASLLSKSKVDKNEELRREPDERSSGKALFNAAVNGDTNKVREILMNHPDAVRFQNDKRQTALHAAVLRGHVDAVNVLALGKVPLEHPDEAGDTALSYAVHGNKPDIIKTLLLAGSNINAANNKGLTPLHLASQKGHQACAEALLMSPKCDVNYQNSDGDSPLFLAIHNNSTQIIHLLINHPRTKLRQVNKKGFSSLHHAVFCQNSFAVGGILRKSPSMINVTTLTDNFTALHIAALNGLTEITLILVKQANCNKEVKTIAGQTALHMAIDKTHNKCIEALVNNGANVNAQDGDGDTSLHLVMIKASMKDIIGTPLGQLLQLVQQLGDEGSSSDEKSNLVAIAVYLIRNDADIYITNKKGKNVLDVTLNPEVEKLLKDHYQRKRLARAMKNSQDVNCKVS